MQRFVFRLLALCLALSWLPATAHCRLEAVGLAFAACGGGCHDEPATPASAADDCSDDACDVVENGFYKTAADSARVPVPQPSFELGLLSLLVMTPVSEAEPRIAPSEAERPREWIAQWSFVRRAVALAQAPAGLNA